MFDAAVENASFAESTLPQAKTSFHENKKNKNLNMS